MNNKRVGIFIDGQYYSKVSGYFRNSSKFKSFLNIEGIIESAIDAINTDWPCCLKVVSMDYYSGKISAYDAEKSGRLYADRVFEDTLLHAGVRCNYIPISSNQKEKGIDVLLALDVYEAVRSDYLDIVILITGDGDFAPLAKKTSKMKKTIIILGANIKRENIGISRQLQKESDLTIDIASSSFLRKYSTSIFY